MGKKPRQTASSPIYRLLSTVYSRNVTQHFAAQPGLTGALSRHHALGGGKDAHAEAAQNRGHPVALDVDAAAGSGDALDGRDHAPVVVPVSKHHSQCLLLRFLAHLEVVDVALFLENAGDLHLELGTGHLHALVTGVNAVPNPSEHVRDGVRSCHKSPDLGFWILDFGLKTLGKRAAPTI